MLPDRLAEPDFEIIWGLLAWVVHAAGPIPTILDWEGPGPAFDTLRGADAG